MSQRRAAGLASVRANAPFTARNGAVTRQDVLARNKADSARAAAESRLASSVSWRAARASAVARSASRLATISRCPTASASRVAASAAAWKVAQASSARAYSNTPASSRGTTWRTAFQAIRSRAVSLAARSAATQAGPPACMARQMVACSGSASRG